MESHSHHCSIFYIRLMKKYFQSVLKHQSQGSLPLSSYCARRHVATILKPVLAASEEKKEEHEEAWQVLTKK